MRFLPRCSSNFAMHSDKNSCIHLKHGDGGEKMLVGMFSILLQKGASHLRAHAPLSE